MKKETLKKKSNLYQKTASPEQIEFVGKNGIKIYPISEFEFLSRKTKYGDFIDYSVIKNKRWYIEANNNGKIVFFDKIISDSELNTSIAKTIIWYYNKLKEK